MHVTGTWNLSQAVRSASVIRCSGSGDVIKEAKANLPVVVAVDGVTSYSTFAEDSEGSLVCSLLAVLNLWASI